MAHFATQRTQSLPRDVPSFFSNELVDAFPVRILKRLSGRWMELYWNGSEESFLTVKDPPESCAMNQQHPENYRIEVHQSYREWLESWIGGWIEGEMITIDYGDCYPEIYHRRPNGTIRAFLLHENITGPEIYKNIGLQDLTADVNFSDLMHWGADLGLETITYCTQNEFLAPHARNTTQDFYLLHQDGPGSAFKVLVQQPKF